MNWYEWAIIGLAWLLVPIVLILKNRQEEKFRRWQKEAHEYLNKFMKGLNNGSK